MVQQQWQYCKDGKMQGGSRSVVVVAAHQHGVFGHKQNSAIKSEQICSWPAKWQGHF